MLKNEKMLSDKKLVQLYLKYKRGYQSNRKYAHFMNFYEKKIKERNINVSKFKIEETTTISKKKTKNYSKNMYHSFHRKIEPLLDDMQLTVYIIVDKKEPNMDIDIFANQFKFLNINTTCIDLEEMSRDFNVCENDIFLFTIIPSNEMYQTMMEKKQTIIQLFPDENKIHSLINEIQLYSSSSKYFIWCKTKTAFDFLKQKNISNIHYMNYHYDISPIDKPIHLKKENYILLDVDSENFDNEKLKQVIYLLKNNSRISLLIRTNAMIHEKIKLQNDFSDTSNIDFLILENTNLEEIIQVYKNVKYYIDIPEMNNRLSWAIKNHLFIFYFKTCELLSHYPRKQEFQNEINLEKIFSIMKNTESECEFFNTVNNYSLKSNIYHFFQKYNKTLTNYMNSNVGLCSYIDRGIILVENLFSMVFQTCQIYIYLNSATLQIENFLKKFSNIHILNFEGDFKALSKLKTVSFFDKTFNFIIDDDIIYPKDYIDHTCNFLKKTRENAVYSYNGYTHKHKFAFIKIFKEPREHNCNLGTGTLFYKNDAICKTQLLKNIDFHETTKKIFADDTLSHYLNTHKIKRRIKSPKRIYWMKNNPKIRLNKNIGLFEYKQKHNLIDKKKITNIIDPEISVFHFKTNKVAPYLKKFIHANLHSNHYDYILENEKLYDKNKNFICPLNKSNYIDKINMLYEKNYK